MTREEAKKLVEESKARLIIEEHFASGGEIEFADHEGIWKINRNPSFNWKSFNYRIKPELKYRKFEKGDNLLGCVVRRKGFTFPRHLIIDQDTDSTGTVHYSVGRSMTLNNGELFDICEISMDGCATWGPAGVPLPYEQQVEPEKKEDPKVETTSAPAPQSGDWKPGNHPE
jgi:hypothetical protein